MATVYKVLFQIQPAAGGVLEDCPAVPSGKEWIVSRLNVANVGAADDTWEATHAVAGSGHDPMQYLRKGATVPVGENDKIEKITMSEDDLIRVASTNGDVAFTAWGVEKDV